MENATLAAFDDKVREKMIELRFDHDADSTTLMYAKMQEAISYAVDSVLPECVKQGGVKREVSERTKALYDERVELKGKGTKQQYDDVQSRIKRSSLQDFETWVSHCAQGISAAEARGDTKGVYKGVKVLAQKNDRPSPNLTTNHQGQTLGCAEDTAQEWHRFLSGKFAATKAERQRPAMETLPCTQGSEPLTVERFLRGLSRMANNKACGPDGIPAELYKHSKACRGMLRHLLQKIWLCEDVPTEFATATFVMLYKNKGSSDDPTKYRCIGLLSHAFKIFQQCLLEQLEVETEGYLSDWQAGFRKKRGCRDNILILRTIYDEMLEVGKTLFATYIDYSAAFDSVSHKFLDEALKAAGASDKSRALFRAVYAAASAATKVSSTDGEEVLSASFSVDRGVTQGDTLSPLYFILTLELILRRHDNVAGKGVTLGDTHVATLDYADDAALLDEDKDVATKRVSAIAKGSRSDADMHINIDKTEIMHVKEQGRVSKTTQVEAKTVYKHVCPPHRVQPSVSQRAWLQVSRREM